MTPMAHRHRPFLQGFRFLLEVLLAALVGWGVVVGIVLGIVLGGTE